MGLSAGETASVDGDKDIVVSRDGPDIRGFDISDITTNVGTVISVHVTKSLKQGEPAGSFVMNKSITLPIEEKDLSPKYLIEILTILEKFWQGE